MVTLDTGGLKAEYLLINYANESKLYVPVGSLHLISRYVGGSDETAPLHKLGNESWAKTRQKAAEKIRDVAAELLDVYAQREVKKGFKFKYDREEFQQFAATFPFEETHDQAMRLMPSFRICVSLKRWIVWFVVMWALGRLKWRCAPHFWRS